MDKNSFVLKKGRDGGQGTYTAELAGFKIQIPEAIFSDETVSYAEKVINIYPSKLHNLSSYCMGNEDFQEFYPDETTESVMEKLHLPVFRVTSIGGRFTYCNHELDSDHLLDVEFTGLMEEFFSIGIDG